MKKYLVYAKHGWDTYELLYSEQVKVIKGYAVVDNMSAVASLRVRGYDMIHILEENQYFDFETLEVVEEEK